MILLIQSLWDSALFSGWTEWVLDWCMLRWSWIKFHGSCLLDNTEMGYLVAVYKRLTDMYMTHGIQDCILMLT